MNDILNLKFCEIKRGYCFDKKEEKFICNICSAEFEKDEIFKNNERYFTSEKMINIHIKKNHGDMFENLCDNNKKYTGITDNQKEIFKMIYMGVPTNDIAKKTGVAPSTIRHQKFVFKEKAKQAKLYLAIYELAVEGISDNKYCDEIIDIHKGAKMIDDRYSITKEEEETIIKNMFKSISPLVLKNFSPKEKKKIVILKTIANEFEKNRKYSEKEVNLILKEIYNDYVTIRRYLIEYGFMKRFNDCSEYWLE